MDYNKLKTLDAQEPYASMPPEESAPAINAATATTRRLVPLWEGKKQGYERGWWPTLIAASIAHETAAVHAAAVAVLDYYSDARFERIDMDNAATAAMFAPLIGPVMTQADYDALDGLANATTRLVESLGIAAPGEQVVAPQIRRVRSM
jgi:hypothetical protein